MKTTVVLVFFLTIFFFAGCMHAEKKDGGHLLIGNGKMPGIAKDIAGNLHIVYGSGDSIMYSFSADAGKSFSIPALVATLHQLTASAMRGPQIACEKNGAIVMASNKAGDIFSYKKDQSGKWLPPVKVNDADTVAKEGFLALDADGNNAFSVWLDLRGDKHNKIVGAISADGGSTWSKNIIVYNSPDSSVCECCKPSVALRGEKLFILFRNWLHGNRDMYLISSYDGGNNFAAAQKLGTGSWALKGCPMDGGGLVIDDKGEPQTVWRRNNTIYACTSGQPESIIDKGKACTLASVNGKNVFAWTDNGEVIIRKPGGMKINLGQGQLPLLKGINNEHVLCVWENDRQIYAEIINL